MSRSPTWKDRWEYLGLSAVLWALRSLPPNQARQAGVGLAGVMRRVAPIRRERALRNLAQAFPEAAPAQCEAIYRNMMSNLGRVLADFARMPRLNAEAVLRTCPVEGLEHFENLRRAKRGAVLLTAHFGNWELLGASSCAAGLPVVFLGGRQRNPYVERLFNRRRTRLGGTAVSLGDGLRPLVRHLQAGRILATLADQDGGRDGFFLDFLGTPASVRPGVFRLMARLDAPMITGFSWWDGDGWKARIDAPVEARTAGGGVEDQARALAALYNRRLEAEVRRRPEQWFWVHHRWRSRPPGESAPPLT